MILSKYFHATAKSAPCVSSETSTIMMQPFFVKRCSIAKGLTCRPFVIKRVLSPRPSSP